MNARTRQEYKNQKRLIDLLGFRYIDFQDKRVINYVANALKKVNTGAYVCSGTISYGEALAGSLENLKVLGLEPYNMVSKFVSTLPLKLVNPVNNGYTCNITYSLDDDTKKVDPNSGTVDHYKVPVNPDLLASLHLGHEHIHALKETNYDEYVDGFIIGDVITMLYEFIMADTYPEMKNEIYKFRLYSLKEDYAHYDNAITQMKKSKDDKDLYKVIATRSGQYLNSYYYASVLFNMYKNDPQMILDLVNKVLKHEMTTREMLELLGIFHQDKNSVFDTEFEKVKMCVKKV